MKKKIRYSAHKGTVEREITYIPVRYIFAVLITLIETLAVIGVVFALSYFVPYFYIAVWITQIACVIRIISSDDNPDYKIPWLLFVLILPIAGFMLYFLFYSRTLGKKYLRRLKAVKAQGYQKDDTALFERLQAENSAVCAQARMLCNIAETHLFTDTKQEYFPLGENMHERLLRDLRAAQKFIYMEYFIIEEGKFWDSILEILKEKAAAGVDIRVVYDDIGCMATLPGSYSKTLKKYGISAVPFSRLKGNADSEFNNRSHRKITVIDGFIAYTGGVNIADEYINAVEKFGHWKDIGMRLEGEAAWALTRLFLIDYGINTKELPAAREDLYPARTERAGGYIVPFGDGPRPLYKHKVGKCVVQNILAGATKYVYIMTPYLIVDNELCQSIENAALRGVNVKIIVPHIPDKKLVFAMTRSFCARLMAAGVEIYEYEPGFVHAKCYLADDEVAMLGTINLDYRSLVHHFENGVWLYRTDCIEDIKADMLSTMEKCIKVTPEAVRPSLLKRFMLSIVRIFAPLL